MFLVRTFDELVETGKGGLRVGVDQQYAMTAGCDNCAKVGGEGGFANTSFSGADRYFFHS